MMRTLNQPGPVDSRRPPSSTRGLRLAFAGQPAWRAILFVGLACGEQPGPGEALVLGVARAADVNSGLIAEENRKSGSDDWQLTRVRVDGSGYRSTWIEG